MPRIKSAKKRQRQNIVRAARNRGRKERLKKAVRQFKDSLVQSGSDETAAALAVSKVSKAFDQAGARGLLHRNAVNRRKSNAARAASKAIAGASAERAQ